MKINEVAFKFRGWVFVFTPVGKKKINGIKRIKWKVIVEWRGKKYRTYYYAYVPSAQICRMLKKSKYFLNHPLTPKP